MMVVRTCCCPGLALVVMLALAWIPQVSQALQTTSPLSRGGSIAARNGRVLVRAKATRHSWNDDAKRRTKYPSLFLPPTSQRSLSRRRQAVSSSENMDETDPTFRKTFQRAIILLFKIAILPLRLLGFMVSSLIGIGRKKESENRERPIVVNGDSRASFGEKPSNVKQHPAPAAVVVTPTVTVEPPQQQQQQQQQQKQQGDGVASVPSKPPPVASSSSSLSSLSSSSSPVPDKKKKKTTTTTTEAVSSKRPAGPRWATAAVDLSGEWTIVASDDFKQEYDEYLKQLGQPLWVRTIALGIIGITSEKVIQTEQGRSLLIRGSNARGVWERTLVASGADDDENNSDYKAVTTPIVTADGEDVQSEAWWENQGTVHRSWMRGVDKFGGGDFESRRYLEQNGKILVCETVFHHRDTNIPDTCVTWRFLRNGATL